MQEYASVTAGLLEFMLNHADAWLVTVKSDLTVSAWNATARRESGYDRTDFSTLPELVDLLIRDPDERSRMLGIFTELGEVRRPVVQIETPVVTRSGELRAIAWNIDFLPDPDCAGEMIAVALGIDVFERLVGEQTLHKNETIHRLLLENLQEGIWWVDAEGRSLYANGRLAELIGVHPGKLVGRRIDEFLSDGLEALTEVVFRDAELRRSDGSRAFVHVSGGPLDVDRDGVHGALLSIVDLSEQRRLSEEHALLVQAITQASESIVITDADARIRYVNPAFTRSTGYSETESIGKNPRFLQSGEHDRAFYAALWREISAGREWKGVFRNRKKGGSLCSEEAVISPVHDERGCITGYIGVKRDVTRELELQKYLQTSQKLQAVGTLAGGVAHDFNNILMAILGYADLARSSVESESQLARRLDAIRSAASRARDLADQLLTFSRGVTPNGDPSDLADCVGEAVAMLRATTPTTIAITTDLEDSSYRVPIGRTEVVQIVMNLGMNAAAAVAPDASGRISITVHSQRTPESTLVLTVSDNGIGMDEETLARVFEPFFSTRPVGKGTGMGLAVVHGIVTGVGGTVSATSTPGTGTSFVVSLPAVIASVRSSEKTGQTGRQDNAAIPEANKRSVNAPAKPRIMIVDDEKALVEMLSDALGRDGFRVESFTDSLAAYDSFSADPARFSLVLTDITMPNLRGDRLAEQMKALRPDLPIVGFTGYSAAVDERQATAAGIHRLLRKPVDTDELADALRRVLLEEDL